MYNYKDRIVPIVILPITYHLKIKVCLRYEYIYTPVYIILYILKLGL